MFSYYEGILKITCLFDVDSFSVTCIITKLSGAAERTELIGSGMLLGIKALT